MIAVTKALPIVVLAALLWMALPALALAQAQPPQLQLDDNLIGLPVFTSDGQRVGVVVEVGVDDEEPVVIAEIDRLMGFGSIPVAIPAEMFASNGTSIELTITAAQLRKTLRGSARK